MAKEPVYLHLNPEFPENIMKFVGLNKIKMVYWDLGGTLVDLSPAIKERAVRKINVTYHRDITIGMFEQAIRVEWKHRESPEAIEKIKLVNDERKEKQYWIEFYSCVLKHLGIRLKDRHIVKWLATMQSNPRSFVELPHVRDTIKKLHDEKIPVGVISNGFPSARRILEESGLIQEFKKQHVILSYEYNSVKPERIIYREAIRRAKVKPYEILFLDDRRSFVDGALRSGMNAVVICDAKGEFSGSGKPALGIIEYFARKWSVTVRFVTRRIRRNVNQLARLDIRSLWHQSIQNHIESSLLRLVMLSQSVKYFSPLSKT